MALLMKGLPPGTSIKAKTVNTNQAGVNMTLKDYEASNTNFSNTTGVTNTHKNLSSSASSSLSSSETTLELFDRLMKGKKKNDGMPDFGVINHNDF
jgi:hypothetical protein